MFRCGLVAIVGLVLCCSLPGPASAQPPVRIMPLGDSITKGTDGSVEDVGYRRPLYLSLTGAEYNVEFVGSQSDGFLNDFDNSTP